MSDNPVSSHRTAHQLSDNVDTPSTSAMENNETDLQPAWFDTVRGAAMTAKASFPDQLDYYDPEADDII
jgi:4-hydroxy-3-methylbut-2-enyl diphosphate reductase IspH